MTLDHFKDQLAQCNECLDADALCFKYLREAAKEYGLQGEIAVKLLRLAEEVMQ